MNKEQQNTIEYDAVLKILDVAKEQKQNIGELFKLDDENLNKYDIEFIKLGYGFAIQNVENIIKYFK